MYMTFQSFSIALHMHALQVKIAPNYSRKKKSAQSTPTYSKIVYYANR